MKSSNQLQSLILEAIERLKLKISVTSPKATRGIVCVSLGDTSNNVGWKPLSQLLTEIESGQVPPEGMEKATEVAEWACAYSPKTEVVFVLRYEGHFGMIEQLGTLNRSECLPKFAA